MLAAQRKEDTHKLDKNEHAHVQTTRTADTQNSHAQTPESYADIRFYDDIRLCDGIGPFLVEAQKGSHFVTHKSPNRKRMPGILWFDASDEFIDVTILHIDLQDNTQYLGEDLTLQDIRPDFAGADRARVCVPAQPSVMQCPFPVALSCHTIIP